MAVKKQLDHREIFNRTLKVASAQLERVEKHIAAGNKGVAGAVIDTEALRATRELGALVNSLTKTQEALQAKGMAHVGTMSQAEQFAVCMRFVCGLSVGYRQQAVEQLEATLAKPKTKPKKKGPKA